MVTTSGPQRVLSAMPASLHSQSRAKTASQAQPYTMPPIPIPEQTRASIIRYAKNLFNWRKNHEDGTPIARIIGRFGNVDDKNLAFGYISSVLFSSGVFNSATDHYQTRLSVLRTLADVGGREAHEAALSFANNKDSQGRMFGEKAIAGAELLRMGDIRGLDILRELFEKRSNFDNARFLIEELGRTRDERVVDLIIKLDDLTLGVLPYDIIDSLGKIGGTKALKHIEASLPRKQYGLSIDDMSALCHSDEVRRIMDSYLISMGSSLRVCAPHSFLECKEQKLKEMIEVHVKSGDLDTLDYWEHQETQHKQFIIMLNQFLNNYPTRTNLNEPPFVPSLDPIREKAGLIRAVCREKYHQGALENKCGDGNRGSRCGKKSTNAGWDIVDLRTVQMSQANSRAIDWGATARLPEVSGEGMVVERLYRVQGRNKVMIVVDPRSVEGADRKEKASLIAGTISQMAFQRGDSVGLVIGKKKVYIGPSHEAMQIERILRAIDSYHEDGQTDGLVSILDQDLVRKNMPKGSEIFVLTSFSEASQEGLTKLCRTFRNFGVELIPVFTAAELVVPHPTVKIGRFKFRARDNIARLIANSMALLQQDQMKTILLKTAGVVIDAEGKEGADMIVHVIAAMQEDRRKKREIKIAGRVAGEKEIDITTPAPQEVLDKLRSSTFTAKWESFVCYKQALCNGWEEILVIFDSVVAESIALANRSKNWELAEELMEIKYYMQNGDMRGRFSSIKMLELIKDDENAEGYIDEFSKYRILHDEIGSRIKELRDAEQYSAVVTHLCKNGLSLSITRRLYAIVQKLEAEKAQEKKHLAGKLDSSLKRMVARVPSMPNLANERILSPISAFDEDRSDDDERVWMTLSPAPSGRSRYYRSGLAVAYDPGHASYKAVESLSIDQLVETGEMEIKGKLANKLRKEDFIPIPAGGSVVKANKKEISFFVNGDKLPAGASKVLSMKLSEFRKQITQLYGKELGAKLTSAPTAEQLENIAPEIAEEWKKVVAETQSMKVAQAIKHIQGYVLSHKRIKYHRAETKVEKILFAELKRKAEAGECEACDNLKLIIQLGGGVCAEMSVFALNLMRMAGIPTALSHGWIASGSRVKIMPHRWPEAIVALGDGKMCGIPVEASRIGATLAIPSFAEMIGGAREEIGKKELAMPELDKKWREGTLEQRILIARAIDLLRAIVEFSEDKLWTRENAADYFIRELRREIGFPISDFALLHIDAELLPTERLRKLDGDYYRKLEASDPVRAKELLSAWYQAVIREIP
ncbi:hypothetical protein HZC34_04625 [Candidatus Saganbacteria bacterium]|nr:hypothetical protein [Candidatus Saganbacteria bacterium]